MPTLACRTSGETSKSTILFLHGFLGSAEDWRPTIDALSSRFRCIAIDLPGHGKSVGLADDQYELPETLALIREARRELAGDRPHLVGYSMGGRLALLLALESPELFKSFTLISASPGLRTAQERGMRIRSDELVAERLEEDVEDFLREWYARPIFAPLMQKAELLEAIIARRLQDDPQEWAKALHGTGVGRQPSLWETLGSITVPALLLTGAHDSKFRAIADAMKAANERFQTETIAASGHAVHLEQPHAVAEAIERFVTENDKGNR